MSKVTHEYECHVHGRFDRSVTLGASPPPFESCPFWEDKANQGNGQVSCGVESPWVPPRVGIIWKI